MMIRMTTTLGFAPYPLIVSLLLSAAWRILPGTALIQRLQARISARGSRKPQRYPISLIGLPVSSSSFRARCTRTSGKM